MSCPWTRREFIGQGGCLAMVAAALGLGETRALAVSALEGKASGNERRYPLPAGDGVEIDRGAALMLVRLDGRVYAFALSCPHQNAAVKWIPTSRRFQCTKHDSHYTPEGVYEGGRATRNLDRFPIRLDGDAVIVTIDRVFHSDADTLAWADAVAAV